MRKSVVASLSLSPKVSGYMDALMKKEKKNRSQIVCEAVERYYTMSQWADLQAKGRECAVKAGVKNEEDVERLVHQYRRSKG